MSNEAERDLPQLLDQLAQEAAQLLGAERASIFLLDESRSELWSQVALGSDEVLRFDARLGIAGAVALGAQPILVPDVAQDDRFYPGMDERTGFVTRSLVAAPLIAPDGESLGAFEVLNKREGSFSEADRDVLVHRLSEKREKGVRGQYFGSGGKAGWRMAISYLSLLQCHRA